MKKEAFAILVFILFSSFACAIPPILVGWKDHVNSARIGEKVLISYNFDKIGEGVSTGRREIDVFLIIDTSGSMESKINGVKKIDSAKDAAKAFIDGLNPSLDRIGLGIINEQNTNRVLVNLTNDFDKVISEIDSLSATGKTTHGSTAVNQSVEFLKDYGRDDALKSIFLFTDGMFISNYFHPETWKINSTIADSVNLGINTHTSFFGDNSTKAYREGSSYLKELAKTGNGKYFDSPTGEELKETFLKVLNTLKENVASDFVLNDSFLPGVKILDEGFPDECQKFSIDGKDHVSCKRKSLFSLNSEPFNFSFFVNITSKDIDKLSTNTFVDYKNYSGEESILFLKDKSFRVMVDNEPPEVGKSCISLPGGVCSSSPLQNSEQKSEHSCGVVGEKCYVCITGFSFNYSSRECVKEENVNDPTNWSCVKGSEFSYWKDLQNNKKWIYDLNNPNLIGEARCDEYGNALCCPDNLVCGSDGKCTNKSDLVEYCSSFITEDSCRRAPESYAKNEIRDIRKENFAENTCSGKAYTDPSNASCSLKSSCTCVWNPSSNTCSPDEKIVRSCQSNGNNKSDSDDDDDDKKKDSDEDSSKKRYYSTGAVIKGLGNYSDLENYINLSRTEKHVDNRANSFFWMFIIILLIAIIVLAYLISRLNKKE